MNKIYKALNHLKNYNDPHQAGIADIRAELVAEEKTIILTNTLTYPLNDSVQTVTLDNVRIPAGYWVETEVVSNDGNVGGIIMSDKQLDGFKIEFTGSATTVTIKCRIRGGICPLLPPLGTDLDDCTWEQISKISEFGLAADYFSVGDCKAVHLQGTIGILDINETYYAFILGFDHNHEIEGRGISFGCFKTAKTDGIDVALVNNPQPISSTDGTKYFNINHSENTTVGGWQGCDLRYDILGSVDINDGQDASPATAINPVPSTLMSALPADLRIVMKPIIKYTDNVGGGTGDIGSNVTSTIDYLPLLSEYEVFGVGVNGNSEEQNHQQQYAYYSSGNSKIKYESSDISSPKTWNTRSIRCIGDGYFTAVSEAGVVSRASVNSSQGVSPIFLV